MLVEREPLIRQSRDCASDGSNAGTYAETIDANKGKK
jgi:hypothetical protein